MESAGIFVDEVDERPARLVRILGISVVGWAIFTALNLARARSVSASIDLFVTGAIAAALVIGRRFPRRVGWAAHAGGALCAGGLTVVSLVQGQSAAMASWFLVASPIFGGYIGGRRAAIGWTIAASLLLAIVHLSPLWVQIEPEFVHEEPEVWMGALVLTLALLSFAIADLRVHREHVEALARRGATVAAQARELAAARDRAVALAAAKDEFLATMSHEIRTPLNGVLGLAEVLARSELSPRDAERVRTIVSSGEALRTLLSDLLEAARADSGKLELDPRPVHVPTLLARCVELMRAQAESKGLALSLAVDDGVGPWAVLDEVRARQVILNLLGNAVKFTPQGQVRVAARALAGAGAGPEL
ncbi:MAG TPA: histidine kinase dimerization/phospho-acceptor domain-containing protein, partial [Nannocystaceae bacterium]|nr:histidine kinase dimerization/phospho-acceptor domain-containing protein [Nannocystaceae bacterium]